MRLIVLDKNFETLGSIPLFRTLIWVRRYEKLGYFELYTSREYFDLMNSGEYLYRNDADELGVIDEVNYSQDENGSREAYAKGNFAEALLADLVIERMVTLNGNIEIVMRNLVTRTAISPSDNDRVISHLRLGAITGIEGTLNTQTTGDNLSEKLYEIGNTQEISHRIRFDYLTNDLIFEVWKGKDRRDSQDVNSWAVFSNSFRNIKNVVYNRNSANYKNFAYVAGEGEGAERVFVEVDVRVDRLEKRRELFVDARDLRSEDGSGNKLTSEQYHQLLIQRGKEKLAEYRKVETVNSGIDPNANLVYKKDFDLGDYCTYVNTEINIATDQRITEAMETYEGSSTCLDIIFGTDEVGSIHQLIKREV